MDFVKSYGNLDFLKAKIPTKGINRIREKAVSSGKVGIRSVDYYTGFQCIGLFGSVAERN